MLGVDGHWQLGDFGASLLFGSSVPRKIKVRLRGVPRLELLFT